MSANAMDPDELVHAKYIHDNCLVDEIDHIDLSHLELDDNDDWLYMPALCSTESTIKDLYSWLKAEPESDVSNNNKYIDTRTFTRPKKRSAQMSFESIFRGLSPYTKSTWKQQDLDSMRTKDVDKYLSTSIEDKEFIPPMLKSPAIAAANIFDINLIKSGQESMEAFLNMSQCKGIDSFINLDEPDFNDPLMNVSQPSIWNASIISSMNESLFVNNDTKPIISRDTKAQEVVHQFNLDLEKKSSSNSANTTFVMQSGNDMISSNEICYKTFLNNTFRKESFRPNRDLNETYDAVVSDGASAPLSSFNREKIETATLSSTFVTEPNSDIINFVQLQNNGVELTDTTNISTKKIEKQQNLNISLEKDFYKTDVNVICDIPSDGTKSMAFLETYAENNLDISFKIPAYRISTPIQPNAASKFIGKHSDPQIVEHSKFEILHSAREVPMSLRRELLEEIQRNDKQGINATYNHISTDLPDSKDSREENIQEACDVRSVNDVPLENRYRSSYEKKSTVAINPSKNQYVDTTHAQKASAVDRKFYTFTKKSNNLGEKTEGSVENVIEKNAEKALPNMDGTFCKPLPKVLRKNPPRILSRLPQFLQKSNPNLVSNSLKTRASASGGTSIFSVGHIKSSQPNIMSNIKKLPSKLCSFDKLRSGSEQRLLNNASEFLTKGAIGSTESIESTQSAHSAPDLDDRLSTCSDGGHNTCNRRTMNIEQLHQLVRMQEESLKQDLTTKPKRQILENTWIKEKIDLPSPILKNGIQYSKICTNVSPQNVDSSIKCSSPISPSGSSHALNSKGNPESNVDKIEVENAVVEKTEEDPNQIVPKVEGKTRLRQPTSLSTGSKSSAVISGIPRLASRIPALRLAKSNAKITQANLKKGYT